MTEEKIDKLNSIHSVLASKKNTGQKEAIPQEAYEEAPTPDVQTVGYQKSDGKKKFHCTGRIVDRKNNATAVTMWLRNELKEDAEKFCSGQSTIYYNQLIELGLAVVKSWDMPKDHDEGLVRLEREREKMKQELLNEIKSQESDKNDNM